MVPSGHLNADTPAVSLVCTPTMGLWDASLALIFKALVREAILFSPDGPAL